MTTFVHRYEPGATGDTVLLLHGTGGDENSLMDLGGELMPGANRLSPRGKVLEGRAPRFFRRLAEGVFDLEDLALRTRELADFVGAAAARYAFDPKRVTAIGFSNGANIAASLLLANPGVLSRAVLLRAMVPFEPTVIPALTGTRVWIGAGEYDEMIPREGTLRLAELLKQGGAEVTLDWRPAGHRLLGDELEAVRSWLSR
ncbi:MAG TPA: alpha/beta hydrolase [Gemmatimonadales bacterium]|nr:alpha/beta hydrolase [Gemmatimonadales bacterium]